MKKLFFSMWGIISKKHQRHGIVLIGLLVFGSIMELLSVGILYPAIKLMQNPKYIEDYPFTEQLEYLTVNNDNIFVFLFVLVLLVYLIKNLCLFCINQFQFNYFASIQTDLSTRLFFKYLSRNYDFFLENNSSTLVRSVTEDIKNVVVLIFFALITIATELLVTIPLFLFLTWLNPLITIITLVIALMCFYVISKFVSSRLKPVGAKLQTDFSSLVQNVQEGIGAIKELKILAKERYFVQLFEMGASSYAYGLAKHLFLNTIPRQILELMFIFVIIGMLVVFSLSDSLYDSLPMLGVYGATSFRLIPGLNRAAAAFNSVNMGLASLKVVVDGLLLKENTPIEHKNRRINFLNLSIQSVNYSYSSGNKVLDNISLDIESGEVIGLIGESGSGKTTLINIILGLLKPSSGSVLVNGEDIFNDLASWQASIGYVAQDVSFIDGTIRSNIALGQSDEVIDERLIWKALKRSNLKAFVESLPNGLDTKIGERGVRFSGGQRQRLGIARALYRDPPFLIMDEATSALDNNSEKEIVKEVSLFKGEKTIIIVAHRYSSLSVCDRILELEDGCIKSVKSYTDII